MSSDKSAQAAGAHQTILKALTEYPIGSKIIDFKE
jgi:hypothetical protein